MVTAETIRKFALSLPETDEQPHFHLRAFRVKKKIFATLDEEKKRMMVKLSVKDQSVFCLYDPAIIYPVPGGWGQKGATYIELKKARKSITLDALATAFCTKAPANVLQVYQSSFLKRE